MSPLAVGTSLESSEFRFDVVIIDEASRVLPWDAIGVVDTSCGHEFDDFRLAPAHSFRIRIAITSRIGDFEFVSGTALAVGQQAQPAASAVPLTGSYCEPIP